MKILRHPGPELYPRRLAAWAETGRDLRIALSEGSDLMNGLVSALTALEIESAGLTFLAGSFARVAFMTGRAD